MSTSWSCERTAASMGRYREGALGSAESESLVRHVLDCPYCHVTHWLPVMQALAAAEKELLDELVGTGSSLLGSNGDTWHEEETPAAADPAAPGLDVVSPGAGATCARSTAESSSSPRPGAGPNVVGWTRLTTGRGPVLRVAGTVLPRLPFPDMVESYRIRIGGMCGGSREHEKTVTQLLVTGPPPVKVALECLAGEVFLDGKPLRRGETAPLSWFHRVVRGSWVCFFEASSGDPADWRESGLLRHSGEVHPLTRDRTLVGRARSCDVVLPDDRRPAGVTLRPSARDHLDPGRAQRLDRLCLDSFEVSRTHAAIEKRDDRVVVVGLGRYPVVRIRHQKAETSERGKRSLSLVPGDLVKIGHGVFEFQVL